MNGVGVGVTVGMAVGVIVGVGTGVGVFVGTGKAVGVGTDVAVGSGLGERRVTTGISVGFKTSTLDFDDMANIENPGVKASNIWNLSPSVFERVPL